MRLPQFNLRGGDLHRVILRQLFAAGAVEALLLAQVVVAIVGAVVGSSVAEPVTFWGYVITVLLVLPAAAAVSFIERSRWSSVILLVAALTTGFLQFRVLTLWIS